MRLKQAEKRKAQDPTIALINVVFLMLIFFLLAGTIAPGADPEIRLISTRDAEGAPPPAEPVGITAEGELRYGGAAIEMDALIAELSTTRSAPEAQVPPAGEARETGETEGEAATGAPLSVTADRDLPARDLIAILRQLREAGYAAHIVTRAGGPQ
ncbi:biopolymer transporter ExbD [Fulvimarina endophytica]|uniref:Biopolymer transporter ExbD n=1 Tax=Fulvimarina endophytica TaxID=2293836 RepID=A0A371X281_9HYPH|nr:biopolymer transporter ExbD [Fulvimarina endophytica]RFC63326.1 biopolymer transporter ExbD [Fulvimarina endophytica]